MFWPVLSQDKLSFRMLFDFLTGALARLSILSSKKTTWLLVKEARKLDEEEQEALTTLRQTSPTADRIYPLVRGFGQMVRQRQGERLDAWLTLVEASAIAELQTFAAGVQRDKAAVQAGLTLF
jgi:transposase